MIINSNTLLFVIFDLWWDALYTMNYKKSGLSQKQIPTAPLSLWSNKSPLALEKNRHLWTFTHFIPSFQNKHLFWSPINTSDNENLLKLQYSLYVVYKLKFLVDTDSHTLAFSG